MFGFLKVTKRKNSTSRKPRTSDLDTNKCSKTKLSVENSKGDKHKRKDFKSDSRWKDSDRHCGLQPSKREGGIVKTRQNAARKSYGVMASLMDIHKMDSGELIHMNLNTDETMADNFSTITSVLELWRHFERSPSFVPVRKSKSNCGESQNWSEKSLEEENWCGSNVPPYVEGTCKQEREILNQHLEETQVLLQKTQKSRSAIDALKEVQAKLLTVEKKKVQYQNDCERYKRELDQVSRQNTEINNHSSKMKDAIANLRKEYEREKTWRKKVEKETNQKASDMRTMLDQAVTKGEDLRNKVEELEEKLRTDKESNEMLERLKDWNNKIQQTLKLSKQDMKEKSIEIKVLKEKLTAAGKSQLIDVKQTFSQRVEDAVQDFGRLSKPLEHKISTMQRRIDKMSEQLLSQKENSGVKTRKLESKLFLLQAEFDQLQNSHKKQIQQIELSQLNILADQREEITLKLQEEFKKQRSIPSKKMEDLEASHQKMRQDNLELKNLISTLEALLWDERKKVTQLQATANIQKKEILEDVSEQTRIQSKQTEDLNRDIENQKSKQEKEALREKISILEKNFEEKVQLEVEHIMRQQSLRIKARRSSVPETDIRRCNISSELQRRSRQSRKKQVSSATVDLNQDPRLLELLIQKQDSLLNYGRSLGDIYGSSESNIDKAKTREKIHKKTKLYKYRRQVSGERESRLSGLSSSLRQISSSYDSKTDQCPMAVPLPKFADSDSVGLSSEQSSSMIKSTNLNKSPSILTGSRVTQLSLEEIGEGSGSEPSVIFRHKILIAS